ncbi:DNA-3-methyladenine glycosylase family protein [Pseudalkalibacillus sp. Hm43]|uniref:DNA-3-methyladenine glycosylase family protein n=1 Tax=Pseudalkalibacillus sp. Hm43 TaxID=3450742 RepID=UPI003F437D3B
MEKTRNLLYIPGPFSFDHTFQRHHRTTDTLKTMVVKREENRFIKWIHLGDEAFLLDASIQNEEDGISIQLNRNVSETQMEALHHHLHRMFGVGNSLNAFYEHLKTNDRLNGLIKQFHGMRVITNPDLFETTVDTIIGQQVNLKFAATLKERLVRLAGEVKEYEGDDLYLFPTAEKVAMLDYEDLRALSFSQRKSEYIIDFARLVANGEIDLDALWAMSNQEIIDRLLPLRGIGVWTIECLMLFGLNRADVLPAADIGLRNAVKMLYGTEKQPKTEEIRLLAEKEDWNPWESYITFYLWQYLNTMGK